MHARMHACLKDCERVRAFLKADTVLSEDISTFFGHQCRSEVITLRGPASRGRTSA